MSNDIVNFYREASKFYKNGSRFDPVRSIEDTIRKIIVQKFVPEQANILDLGCGDGASREYLPSYGDYTGIDISESMLSKALPNQQSEFICSDLSTKLPVPDLRSSYDAAISFYGSLSHLNPEALVGLLSNMKKILRPGSPVILDLLNDTALDRDQSLWLPDKSPTAMSTYSMSYAKGNLTVDMKFYTPQEAAALMETAGYNIVELHTVSALAGRHNKKERETVNRLLQNEQVEEEDLKKLQDKLKPFPVLEEKWNQLIKGSVNATEVRKYLASELDEPYGHALIVIARS